MSAANERRLCGASRANGFGRLFAAGGVLTFVVLSVLFIIYMPGGSTADERQSARRVPAFSPSEDGSVAGIRGDVVTHARHAAHVVETFTPGDLAEFEALSNAQPSSTLEVQDGERVTLDARIVSNEFHGARVKMYGFNGQIPGPSLRVKQGSSIFVEFTNNIDMKTTVHWHGLRLENRFDGVPGVTQSAVKPGASFVYRLDFPDEGIYWYHPHVREDIQQDAGLYGTILVEPKQQGYYNPVNREEVLVVDDLIIQDGEIRPYGKTGANHATMGRFGNVMLINGEDDYRLEVREGDVVRFYVLNVANVRPFNIRFGGAPMKLVGSDIGNYQRDAFVESVLVTPAERYVVEVFFDGAGEYEIQSVTPHRSYILGAVKVVAMPAATDYSIAFRQTKTYAAVSADIEQYRRHFDRPVDNQIDLSVEIQGMTMTDSGEHTAHRARGARAASPIEWEDPMGAANARSTSDDIQWILRDRASGKENGEIDYVFGVGDVVKIRLFNEPKSAHPMQHQIHVHGQRFLVIEQDGVRTGNLVWKDTVNVPTGSYVDILLDVTNPGEWMVHCHIAEHLEAGMMASIKVQG